VREALPFTHDGLPPLLVFLMLEYIITARAKRGEGGKVCLVGVVVFVAAHLFAVALLAEDVALVRPAFAALRARVQDQPAVLALKAFRVKVPAHGSEPGRGHLAVFGRDGLLAEGAFGCLLLVVALWTIDLILLVCYELGFGHVVVAYNAGEAVAVENGAGNSDHGVQCHGLFALRALLAALHVAVLADRLPVKLVEAPRGDLLTDAALLRLHLHRLKG